MYDFFQDLLETCRNVNVFWVVLLLPLLILAAPCYASRDFPVFRLQNFESSNYKNGSFAASVSAEATAHLQSAHRKCFIIPMEQLTLSKLKDIVKIYPLAIIIVLPWSERMDGLSEVERNHWLQVERVLIEQEYPIPIYFTHMSEQHVQNVLHSLKSMSNMASHKSSATKALMDAVLGNGYQVVIGSPQPSPIPTTKFSNIMGSLYNTRRNVELDSILFVAHYDAFSPSAELSYEVDSSGTGVVALLSIAKTLSKLYSNAETQPSLNSHFLLSAGGKINFLGSNYYLQHNDEKSAKSARLVVALDSLNGMDPNDMETLYMHRKATKSTASNVQLQELNRFQQILSMTAVEAGLKFEVITTRKSSSASTSDHWYHWEHERYSALRAATISAYPTAHNPIRHSILDNGHNINNHLLIKKIEVVQKALLLYMYNISSFSQTQAASSDTPSQQDGQATNNPDEQTAKNPYQNYTGLVEEEEVDAVLQFVASKSHSSQLLSKNEAYVQTLYRLLNRYTKHTSVEEFKLDSNSVSNVRRVEDVIFYDQNKATIAFAYRVKPAVFDLFLSLIIASYIVVIYFAVMNVSQLHSLLQMKLLSVNSQWQSSAARSNNSSPSKTK